jgi:ElaB/YqjD/DUF883 family membrane-anchored ribosome-binding protein
MNKHVEALRGDLSKMSDNTESLMHAARERISEKIEGVSHDLSAGRESAHNLARIIRAKGIACGGVVERELQENSFRYLAIIAGIGALLGFLIACKCATHRASSK